MLKIYYITRDFLKPISPLDLCKTSTFINSNFNYHFPLTFKFHNIKDLSRRISKPAPIIPTASSLFYNSNKFIFSKNPWIQNARSAIKFCEQKTRWTWSTKRKTVELTMPIITKAKKRFLCRADSALLALWAQIQFPLELTGVHSLILFWLYRLLLHIPCMPKI